MFASRFVALAAAVLGSLMIQVDPARAGAATPGENRDPENRCLLSQVLIRRSGLATEASQAEAALFDGRAETAIALAGGETSLEFHFLGAPRWINRVTLLTDAPKFDIEVFDLDRAWRPFVDGGAPRPGGPSEVITLKGRDVYVRGLRFVPRPSGQEESAGEVRVAEIMAAFDITDPDGVRVSSDLAGDKIHANWCNNYPGAGNDLSECDDDVEDFIDDMPGGWEHTTHSNDNSHEEHFKRTDLGGNNGSHVDQADIAYYAGHGATEIDTDGAISRSLRFGDNDYDDNDLTPGESFQAWGDGDMEWMCFSACKTLKDDANCDRWFRCMSGLHLLLGFKTNEQDVDLGDDFADYMVDNGFADSAERIKTSWFDAAEDSHGDGYTARVLGETSSMGRDYLWGEGFTEADPTHNNTYQSWTYNTCGFPCLKAAGTDGPSDTPAGVDRAEPPPPRDPVQFPATSDRGHPVVIDRSLLGQASPGAMPVFNVVPAAVDSPYVRAIGQKICQLGGHFCGGLVGPGNPGHLNLIDGQFELRVCQNTGSIHYHDADNWLAWRTTPPSIPQGSGAVSLAENLLTQLGRRRSDAVVDRVDYMWQSARVVPAVGAGFDIPESTFAIAARVVYKRRLNNLKVDGPGGSMTVALGGGGQVQRIFEGAWRKVTAGPMVSVVPVQSAINFLAANGSDGTVDGIGSWTEQIQIDSWELGYYEYSCRVPQTTVRPVYIFHCTIRETPTGVTPPITSQADVRVWAESLPPDARIDSPADGVCVSPGAQVCFAGSGSGGISPLTYTWSDDMTGAIGTGGGACATLNLPPAGHAQDDSSHTITLTVRDALGREAHASVEVCLRTGASAVGDLPAPSDLQVQSLLPNPTLGSLRVLFSTPRPGSFHLEIFDVAGRLVHAGSPEALDAGAHRLDWTGRTDAGNPVAAGVYYVQLVGPESRSVRKVVVCR